MDLKNEKCYSLSTCPRRWAPGPAARAAPWPPWKPPGQRVRWATARVGVEFFICCPFSQFFLMVIYIYIWWLWLRSCCLVLLFFQCYFPKLFYLDLDVSVWSFYTGGCTIDELGETGLMVGCCLEGMLNHKLKWLVASHYGGSWRDNIQADRLSTAIISYRYRSRLKPHWSHGFNGSGGLIPEQPNRICQAKFTRPQFWCFPKRREYSYKCYTCIFNMVYFLFSHSTVSRCFVSLFGRLIFDLPQAARAAADAAQRSLCQWYDELVGHRLLLLATGDGQLDWRSYL